MKPFASIASNPRVTVIQRGPDGIACAVTVPGGAKLCCLASDGGGWDHVSAHAEVRSKKRIPTWEEMDRVKRLFFHPHEWAMQLHPADEAAVNIHPHVLHIWRPQKAAIPTPPKEFV